MSNHVFYHFQPPLIFLPSFPSFFPIIILSVLTLLLQFIFSLYKAINHLTCLGYHRKSLPHVYSSHSPHLIPFNLTIFFNFFNPTIYLILFHFFQLFKSLYNIFKSQPFISSRNSQSQIIF